MLQFMYWVAVVYKSIVHPAQVASRTYDVSHSVLIHFSESVKESTDLAESKLYRIY